MPEKEGHLASPGKKGYMAAPSLIVIWLRRKRRSFGYAVINCDLATPSLIVIWLRREKECYLASPEKERSFGFAVINCDLATPEKKVIWLPAKEVYLKNLFFFHKNTPMTTNDHQ